MRYRTLGRTGWQVSEIGLGTEYLINKPREHVVSVIREALDQGINYFDLFFAQPEFRENMGAAFKGRRQDAYLVAHLGSIDEDGQYTKTRDPEVAEGFILDFLKRYETDYIDLLMLHCIDTQDDYDTSFAPGGLADKAKELKAKGLVRAIGFSGHTVPTSKQAIESGFVDVLMFPINLAGHGIEGQRELFQMCEARNIGLVAMKVFAGGKLFIEGAMKLEMWHTGTGDMTMERPQGFSAIKAMAYTLLQPGLSTIVPGCANLDELSTDLAYLDAGDEEKDYASLLGAFEHTVEGECVYCNHCLPCPSVIDIGLVNRLLDTARIGMTEDLQARYDAMDSLASDCIQCASCESECPFGVAVIDRMEQAVEMFES